MNKNFFDFLGLLCVICAVSALENDEDEFRKFIYKFGRKYKPGSNEYWKRLKIFQENMSRTRLRNLTSDGTSAWYGVTKFSDMTTDEFTGILKLRRSHDTAASPLVFKPRHTVPFSQKPELRGLPKRIDWREHDIITPIRDQGHCGACWAFSDVETIEAMHAKKTGRLVRYSVEQFIDCAKLGNYGCSGGDTCRALLWMQQANVTLFEESTYPLNLNDGWCRLFPFDTRGIKLQAFTCLSYVSREEAMLHLLATHGPLIVTVDASTWNDYLGGIIMYHCSNYHNHAVQIIGYDLTGPVPFYIIKNSWGENFGDRGFMYIKIGDNLCGLADRVSKVDV